MLAIVTLTRRTKGATEKRFIFLENTGRESDFTVMPLADSFFDQGWKVVKFQFLKKDDTDKPGFAAAWTMTCRKTKPKTK